jgi:hypothetical protein
MVKKQSYMYIFTCTLIVLICKLKFGDSSLILNLFLPIFVHILVFLSAYLHAYLTPNFCIKILSLIITLVKKLGFSRRASFTEIESKMGRTEHGSL